MEVIYYLTSFTRGCFKRRLSHFSKLAELLQNEREWYIELMNAWAETMVNDDSTQNSEEMPSL